MKKYGINQTMITSPNSIEGIKFRIQDLTYIQDGVLENDIAFAESIIQGNIPSNIPVIVSGCIVTKTGNNYDVAEGCIYYQKMFYSVKAQTLTTTSLPMWGINANPFGAYSRNTVTAQASNTQYKVNIDYEMHLVTSNGVRDYNKVYSFKELMVYNSYTFEDLRIVHSFDNFLQFDIPTRMGKAYGKFAGFGMVDAPNVSPMGNKSFAGKFLVGFSGVGNDYNGAGTEGGLEKVKLNRNESGMPNHKHNVSANQEPHSHTASTSGAGGHSHTASTSDAGQHSHNVGYKNEAVPQSASGVRAVSNASNADYTNQPTTTNGSHSHSVSVTAVNDHTHSVSLSNTGTMINVSENTIGSDAIEWHENRPPYVTVAYLVKVALPL